MYFLLVFVTVVGFLVRISTMKLNKELRKKGQAETMTSARNE